VPQAICLIWFSWLLLSVVLRGDRPLNFLTNLSDCKLLVWTIVIDIHVFNSLKMRFLHPCCNFVLLSHSGCYFAQAVGLVSTLVLFKRWANRSPKFSWFWQFIPQISLHYFAAWVREFLFPFDWVYLHSREVNFTVGGFRIDRVRFTSAFLFLRWY